MDAPEYMKTEHRRTGRGMQSPAILLFATLLVILIIMTIANTVAIFSLKRGNGGSAHAAEWTAERQRALAVKLNTEGLKDSAVQAFEKYLESYDVPGSERARISYTLGKIRFEQRKYEDALGYFYCVEIADQASPLRNDTARNIVACLDRLGRGIDAKYALDRHTALRKEDKKPGKRGTVVAKIGNEEITLGDLNDAIQKLPPAQQKQFEQPDMKREFLRQLISRRLLAEKGRARGLDRTPAVAEPVGELEESLLVQKVVEDELKQRVSIDAGDVKLFYEAHPELFSKPERVRLSCLLFDDAAEAEKQLSRLAAGASNKVTFAELKEIAATNGALVEAWANRSGFVQGLGTEPALVAQALQRKSGTLTNAVKVSKGYALVRVDEYHAPRLKDFARVREDVERLYRAQKEQKAMQDLMQEIIAVDRVQIFGDRLTNAKGK